MNTLSIRRFGLALGGTFALTYASCALVMSCVSRETSIRFFNGILHGLDVTPIMTARMSFSGVVIGIIEVFVLGWLLGAIIACFYNVSAPLDTRRTASRN